MGGEKSREKAWPVFQVSEDGDTDQGGAKAGGQKGSHIQMLHFDGGTIGTCWLMVQHAIRKNMEAGNKFSSEL